MSSLDPAAPTWDHVSWGAAHHYSKQQGLQLLTASAATGTALELSSDALPLDNRALLLLFSAYWVPLPVSSKLEIIA